MKNWENIKVEIMAWAFIIVCALFCVFMCSGCSPRYVAVPEYHYESHHTHDTISKVDSVWRERNTVIREADSTILAELGIRLKQGERAILVLRNELERAMSQQREAVHDTIERVDSVRVPYPVEKQLTRWQSLKMEAGGIAFALLIIIVIVFVVCMVKKGGFTFRRPRDGL
jgi:hypothetical protein